MNEPNEILATAIPGEEVKAAMGAQGNEVRFDVPDVDAGIAQYESGEGSIEDLLLARGKYRSIWNREKLAKVLSLAGFEITGGLEGPNWSDGKGWLRVIARRVQRPRPKLPMADVVAIMSLPRIAWTENFSSVAQSCTRLGIDFYKATGVFWGQCMQRVIEQAIEIPKNRYVLTIDYDSVFDEQDIIRLWQIMESNPDVDALFPLQIGRDRDTVLLSIKNDKGDRITHVPAEMFHREVVDCETGHFGLSLIRVDALKRMEKPWFVAQPNAAGEWGDGRVDDDIFFWKAFAKSGRICATPRVRIGHLQLVITWPGEDLKAIHQYSTKHTDEGRPSECATY